MPNLAQQEAVEHLITLVAEMKQDDLLDFHNEVFPQDPTADLISAGGPDRVRQKVTDHLAHDLEIEEILDLWNVALPDSYNVWFDEETGQLHYSVHAEPIRHVD